MEYIEGAPSEKMLKSLDVYCAGVNKIRAEENLKLVKNDIKINKLKMAGSVGIGIAGIGTSALTSILIYNEGLELLTGSLILCSSLLLCGGYIKATNLSRDLKHLLKEEKMAERDLINAEADYKVKERSLKSLKKQKHVKRS